MKDPKALVASLLRLSKRDDRAALAALRRGLGKTPGTAPEMYPFVAPYLDPNEDARWEEACYLIAALFASHPSGDHPAHNFGASFARLSQEGGGPERRFTALLASHRENLPHRLRQAVALLKAHDVPVDWYQLLRDVGRWNDDQRPVQRAWARAFWREPPE